MNYFLISLLFMNFGAAQLPHGFHSPFWRSKPEVQKRMVNEKLLVVSASTGEITSGLEEMKVIAGGVVDRNFSKTTEIIQKFEDLPKVDKTFRSAKWDSSQKTLDLHMSALGYSAKMKLKMNIIEQDKKLILEWQCIEGTFLNMKGILEVIELERQMSEISMTAEYRTSKLPLPKVLMGAGLEVVGKYTAYKMREYIHKNSN